MAVINGVEIFTTWSEYEPFAQWLCVVMEPRLIVDIGTYEGYSAFIFGKYAPKGKVITVDKFPDSKVEEQFKRNMNKLKFSNVIGAKINNPIDTLDLFKGFVDILHIDGDHTYGSVKKDYDTFIHVMGSKSCILMHDVKNKAFTGPKRIYEESPAMKMIIPGAYGLGFLTWDADLFDKVWSWRRSRKQKL